MSEENAEVECSICGKVGGPYVGCDLCNGNRQFVQSRAFTRTEEAQGRKTDPERYSRTGNVSPKIVSLPGSFTPDQQK